VIPKRHVPNFFLRLAQAVLILPCQFDNKISRLTGQHSGQQLVHEGDWSRTRRPVRVMRSFKDHVVGHAQSLTRIQDSAAATRVKRGANPRQPNSSELGMSLTRAVEIKIKSADSARHTRVTLPRAILKRSSFSDYHGITVTL
jgi:hypothetical protein